MFVHTCGHLQGGDTEEKNLKEDRISEATEHPILCILNCDSIAVILYH